MTVSLSSGVGEAVQSAGNKVRRKTTVEAALLKRQQADQLAAANRDRLSALSSLSAVVVSVKDGSFDLDSFDPNHVAKLIRSLPSEDVVAVLSSAGVGVPKRDTVSVKGKAKDVVKAERAEVERRWVSQMVRLFLEWLEEGGRSDEEIMQAAWIDQNGHGWKTLAAKLHTVATLKPLCVSAGLKVSGSKSDLIDRLARHLSGNTADADKAREVKRVKATDATDGFLEAALKDQFPDATPDQLAKFISAHKAASAKKSAARKSAVPSSKLPTVFA